MTLPLTEEMLRQAYEYICTTPPFNKWNLPESDDVKFVVTKDRNNYAVCITEKRKRKYTIQVSSALVGHTLTLMETIAHEAIHIHEVQSGAETRAEHSAAFKKWAAEACRYHGFDVRRF